MELEFWKMNGAGNDFVILEDLANRLETSALPALARAVCERRLGVGADGLMVVKRSESADLKMLFFNADGSEGEMCGNGARCICRYAYERGLSGEEQQVETLSGPVAGQRLEQGRYRIRLTELTALAAELTVTLEEDYPALLPSRQLSLGYAELGTPGLPHAVVLLPGLKTAPEEALFKLGRELRWHRAFPKGANVNFYEPQGDGSFYERTFERGVEDFTYACGTGTGSLAAVLVSRGLADPRRVAVDMRGGRLEVEVRQEAGRITDLLLTGPVRVVAKGILDTEELAFS